MLVAQYKAKFEAPSWFATSIISTKKDKIKQFVKELKSILWHELIVFEPLKIFWNGRLSFNKKARWKRD